MSAYPGELFADEHGYELQRRSPGHSATYIKRINDGDDALYLTVYEDEKTAKLERVMGLVECKIGPFSIPGNFDIFERHVSALRMKPAP